MLNQIVSMEKMNGGYTQTPLKNTGQKLITKLKTWYTNLMFGMS